MVAFFEGRRVHPGVPNIEFGGQGVASRSIKPCMRGRLFFSEEPKGKENACAVCVCALYHRDCESCPRLGGMYTCRWNTTCNTTRNTQEMLKKLRYSSSVAIWPPGQPSKQFCCSDFEEIGRKEGYLSFFNISCVLRVVLHVGLHLCCKSCCICVACRVACVLHVVLHVHPHARVTKTRLFLTCWPRCCCCPCCCCCCAMMPWQWLVQYRVLQKTHRHQQVRLQHPLHPPIQCWSTW